MGMVHYLQIEPTTRCNFTCGFCAGRHMQQQDMPLQAFYQLVDKLDHVTHVELQGEGEPLLHPDFFAMVAYLRQKFPQVKISLITNGSLLTDTIITQLLQASLTGIMVSLETADAMEFQTIRGGKFSRVTRGLNNLICQKTQWPGTVPRVGFAVTLLRSTYASLGAIAELYTELKMDGGILLQPLQTMTVYRQFYDSSMEQNILRREDSQNVNQLIASDSALRKLLADYQQLPNFYGELYKGSGGPEPTCPWLERGLFFSASGIAASCCFIKDTEKNGLAPAGSPIEKILQTRNDLLAQLRRGNIPSQCQGCGVAGKMHRHYTTKPNTMAS